MKVLVRLPLSENTERAPFFTGADGKLCFDGQNYRPMVYGALFEAERGYRIAIRFHDAVTGNTMDAGSARKIADRFFSDGTPENEAFAAVLRGLADECDRLNEAWARAGKPPAGIGHVTQPSRGSA